MLFLIFISAYFLLMIVGSLSITGWYAITRGRIEYNAFGTPYRTGKIFKGWHFFWTQHKLEPQSLEGKRLVDLYVKMKDNNVNISGFDCALKQYLVFENLSLVDRCYLQAKYDIMLIPFNDLNSSEYEVVVYEKIFRFPELVRDPISECPTCLASVYGTIIWWSVQLLSGFEMFSWAGDFIFIALILFWGMFCIGCAFLNTFFIKKI